MELQIDDLTGRPYTTNAGKGAHARVGKVGQPDVTWPASRGAQQSPSTDLGAHERMNMHERARRSDDTTKDIDHIGGGSTLLDSPECRNVLNPAQEFVNDEPDGRQPQHRTKYLSLRIPQNPAS
jgi:hypothetical protein